MSREPPLFPDQSLVSCEAPGSTGTAVSMGATATLSLPSDDDVLSFGSRPRRVDPAALPLDDAAFDVRYQALRVLGRGGMGEVRLCDDRRIGREVAVKVMRADGASNTQATARFVREARVQAQLEHPAIVPVHDVGLGPDGAPYFTMKRLRGMTLEEILDGLRRGDKTIAELHSRRKLLTQFASVCEAIEFAHTRGVVHRDLKPCNVMLGDFGEVYVLDWGVARVLSVAEPLVRSAIAPGAPGAPDALTGVTPHLTVDGAVLGTPGYMAPEQIRGEISQVDARADVYALGAILFEVVTLLPLHERSTVKAVLSSTLTGADARATVRAPDRDVPPELEAICVRATKLHAHERYPSARALVLDLERYLDGDRDLERRRVAAQSHAEAAARAADRALQAGAGDDDARREAIREAGRALAQDPAHPVALATVSRLLLEPPRAVPAEVTAMMIESLNESSRRESFAGAFGYLACLFALPLFMWMGVRDWGLIAWIGATAAVNAASGLLFVRVRNPKPAMLYASAVANAFFVGMCSRVFGPYVVLPALAVTSTIAHVAHVHLQRPWITVTIGASSIVVPVLLEWGGVLSPTTSFEGGKIVILPHMVDFPPLASSVAMLLLVVSMLTNAATLLLKQRHAQLDAERRAYMQSWQLRHLMSPQADGAPPRAENS